ncbi:hypothetical protein JCM19037_4500 [Geomicrobium sp. JCM 19037]|uniref:hypothetical protein n=1 Tax=Geomicrobium sp. JCM 19037 TaxID=1460634 RepID=UPI00045F156B|nr:hypothetical protein [Geomicrobium sp. JCM 19037]GAK05957.1 hypothetical protein JCM19037_4500 [Geomicrobium sp. JCM 19037]
MFASETKSWIKRNARPLEHARWQYLFEGRSSASVLECLTAFQNEDGGFGHGLEPDVWLPNSSAIATWSAGQILLEVEATRNEPVVQRMLTYLMNAYDESIGLWRTVIREFNDYAHAPWWTYSEEAQQFWMYNPSVELAAFLIYWGEQGGQEARLGWRVIEKATDRILSCTEMDFHEINNFQNMLNVVGDDWERGKDVKAKLHELVHEVMNKEPDTWEQSYSPTPLQLITSPEDELYPTYEELVEENLRFLKRQIQPSGVWDIPWEWEGDALNFAVAKEHWKGIRAVNHIKTLRTFAAL